MLVRICVAVRESTTSAALSAARLASGWADLVELRADHLQHLDVSALLREKPCPVIFTLRSRQEGGEFPGTEGTRIKALIQAAREGADYVDVEFSADWKAVLEAAGRERVILSHHDFEGTPHGLETLLGSMVDTGAGVLKVVTRARCLRDNLRIARLLDHARDLRVRVIALAMGREGIPSRILGPGWGSWLTFASLPGGDPTAEGQIPADEMLKLFRVRQIGPATRIYGVLGRPLGHSLSPRIHNAAFSSREMNAVFIPFEASSVEDFRDFQEGCPIEGASVTIPYKEQVCSLVESLSSAAERTGAVNTLVRNGGGWHGENTDVEGFLRPLRKRMRLDRTRAVVLGSGGAARAAVYGLRSQGASVLVASRNAAKARALADRFQAESAPWEDFGNLRWNLLVNATPVGMYPGVEESPVPAHRLHGDWVFDLVYNPRETRLLRDAALRGCKTITGDEMFLEQALEQHRLWLGSQGPEEVMRTAMEEALAAGCDPTAGRE